MLRTLIIDDEANIRNMIAEILKGYCKEAKVVGQAGSVHEAYNKISALKPDLVLLDIKMDDGTGFDLLEKLENVSFKVIFITAYQEFALKAIKFSALDYILKPIDPDELISAVKQAGELILEQQQLQIRHLTEGLNSSEQEAKKILLKTSDSIHLVKLSDIIFCKSEGGYALFHLCGNNTILVSRPLSEYNDLMTDYGFCRVHKSYLVNMQKMLRFEREDGGYLVMEEDLRVPVASRKKDQLMDLLEQITE